MTGVAVAQMAGQEGQLISREITVDEGAHGIYIEMSRVISRKLVRHSLDPPWDL